MATFVVSFAVEIEADNAYDAESEVRSRLTGLDAFLADVEEIGD